jgi:hypothetical protein
MSPLAEVNYTQQEVLKAARAYGLRLAEEIIERHGVRIDDDLVDPAVALVTNEVLQRVREMHQEGLPTSLAIDWGHECINALMDRILEHVGYLMMGAALVAFDPWAATRQ